MPLFDRKSLICFEVFWRKSNHCCGLRRGSFDWHTAKVPSKNRPTATQNRPDATFSRHLETRSGHFALVANSDLRRIASDFLTIAIRMGETNAGRKTGIWESNQNQDDSKQRQLPLPIAWGNPHASFFFGAARFFGAGFVTAVSATSVTAVSAAGATPLPTCGDQPFAMFSVRSSVQSESI